MNDDALAQLYCSQASATSKTTRSTIDRSGHMRPLEVLLLRLHSSTSSIPVYQISMYGIITIRASVLDTGYRLTLRRARIGNLSMHQILIQQGHDGRVESLH
jgi:hypothetical protein